MTYKIFPISENALTIDFGNEISPELNEKVIALGEFIEKHKFSGFIESVPAYSSLTIFYDLVLVKKSFCKFPTVFSAVSDFVEYALANLEKLSKRETRLIKIPVCYDEKYSPDLDFVAKNANLTLEEVIKIHHGQIYRVFMVGFLPAFAYMGEVDARIATPRKETPRTNVPKGSVGIAGKQTGIYPFDSPGGWQIIGRTNLEMFQPYAESVSFLKTGDLIEFYQIADWEK